MLFRIISSLALSVALLFSASFSSQVLAQDITADQLLKQLEKSGALDQAVQRSLERLRQKGIAAQKLEQEKLEKQKREENNLYYRQSILEEDLIANNFDMDNNSRMALSDVAKRLTELGKGMRMNTDLTYIQDILINLGFEMDVMSLGGRKIKVFKISQRRVSRSQSDL